MLSHAVLGVHTIGDALCLPHSPSRLLLRAEMRAVQVQILKAPTKFEAHLPHGPENISNEIDDAIDSLTVFNTPTEQL